MSGLVLAFLIVSLIFSMSHCYCEAKKIGERMSFSKFLASVRFTYVLCSENYLNYVNWIDIRIHTLDGVIFLIMANIECCGVSLNEAFSVFADYAANGWIDYISCGKTRRYHQTTIKDVRIVDGNHLHNSVTLNKFFRRDEFKLDLHGYTYIDDLHQLPFPVYCDKQTLLRFLKFLEGEPNHNIRDLYLNSTFSPRIKEAAKPLFASVLYKRSYLIAGLDQGNNCHQIFVFAFIVVCQYYLISATSMLAFAFFIVQQAMFPVKSDTFAYCFMEESFSAYAGFFPVPYHEFVTRIWASPIANLGPLTLHCVKWFLPFPLRVLVHWYWNIYACKIVRATPTELIEQVSYVVDLVHKIHNKDIVGLTLSMGMRARHLANLCSLLRVADISSFNWDIFLYSLREVPKEELEVEEEDPDDKVEPVIKITSSEKEDTFKEYKSVYDEVLENVDQTFLTNGYMDFEFLYSWLPENIRKSPTFSKSIILILIIVQSQYFDSFYPMKKIAEYMSNDDFLSKGSLVSDVASCMMGVWKGMERAISTQNWRAFFDAPRDVKFLKESSQLIYAIDSADTVEKVSANLAHAESLVASRLFLNNTPDQCRIIEKLNNYINLKKKFVRAQSHRAPPAVIWIVGEPGTGKTTIIESIIRMLTVRLGKEKFLGQVSYYNFDDKYPLSTGINEMTEILVINDLKQVFSNSSKNDLLCFSVVMQQLIDSTPFYVRAADIESKGKVLNNIKYVIITSNHHSYVCEGETEKLQRRFADSLIVDCYVADKNDAAIPFDQFRKYDQATRNHRTCFRVLKATCKEKRVVLSDVFPNKRTTLNYNQFFDAVITAVEVSEKNSKRIYENFQNDECGCPCGVALAMHIYPVKDSDIVCNRISLEQQTFVCRSPLCKSELFPTSHFRAYVAPVHVDASVTFILLAISCMCIFTKATAFGFNTVCEWMDNFVLNDSCFDYLYNMIKELKGDYEAFKLVCYRTFLKIKKFISDYKQYFVGASVISICAILYTKLGNKQKELFLSPVIYPNQVRDDSMVGIKYRHEQNFPLAKTVEWGKGVRTLETVSFTKGVAMSDLERVIEPCIVDVTISYDTQIMHSKVLILAPGVMVLNKHYVCDPKTNKFLSGKFIISLRGVTQVFEPEDFKGNDMNELFVVQHSLPIAVPSLIRYLPEKFVQIDIPVVHMGKVRHEAIARPSIFHYFKGTYSSLQWKEKGAIGMCSEPVIGKLNGGSVLLGMVSYMKNDNDVGCSLLSKEWYESIMAKNPYPNVSDIILTGMSPTVDLSINSELRNVSDPNLVPIGTIPGPNEKFSSHMRKTIVHDEFASKLSEEYSLPNSGVRGIVDGEWNSSFANTFSNISMQSDLTMREVNFVVKSMLEDVASKQFVDDQNIRLRPLTLKDAIFGDERLGIGRIDFKTSTGPFLKKEGINNKYDMFEKDGDEYILKPEVSKRISDYHDILLSGAVVAPFVHMVHKDEARPKAKLNKKKIRLFSVLDAAFNLLGRQYLMPLIQLLLRFPERSECYGGINAASSQWNDLANRMRAAGITFDMDFKNFDASHWALFFEAAARYFFLLALRVGYLLEEACVVYLLFVCFKIQLASFMLDLFLKFKGMPSGVIFTLILNSFINSFLFRVAFLRIFGNLDNFQKKVSTANVGDDNINRVDLDLSSKFNMITISEIYSKLGYIATPANKSGKIQTNIPFEELTFLKRNFVWSDDLGSYVAPISLDSIFKAFCFEKKDAGTTSQERLKEVASGAQREAFLHGRIFFENFKEMVSQIYSKFDLTFIALDYEQLKAEYINGVMYTYV